MHVVAGSFLFGITLAAAVGPIALLIVRAGLEQGFSTALRCALGAASADLLFAGIAFTAGAAALARLEALRAPIELVGACLLVLLGAWLAFTALRHPPRGAAPRRGFGYGSTLALTLVNPLTILFFVSFASQLDFDSRGALIAAAVFAIFAGSLCVQLALAATGAFLRRRIGDPRLVRALNVASGLGIAAFGMRGLLSS